MKYADVIISDVNANIDKIFTYSIKTSQQSYIYIGSKVIVPLGYRQKFVEGIVVSLKDNVNFDTKKLKNIRFVLDGIYLNENLVNLGIWMKNYCLSSYGDIFRMLSPTGLSAKIEEFIEWNIEFEPQKALELYINKNQPCTIVELEKTFRKELDFEFELEKLHNDRKIKIVDHISSRKNIRYKKIIHYDAELARRVSSRAIKQIECLSILKKIQNIEYDNFIEQYGITKHIINELVKKDIVKVELVQVNRYINQYAKNNDRIKLNEEQLNAYNRIVYDLNKSESYLIHGITGSGKTEIYMEVIEKMLEIGKNSIVLVPEISLTPQTICRFSERFGEKIAVLHSHLSVGEKYDEWCRISNGDAQIIIGARSAIFAPIENLGVIIIDEEHDASYKSGMSPKYDTRDIALKRAKDMKAKVIFGSATPSVETYKNATEGKYVLIEVLKRAKNAKLPDVQIVDMRQELENGNKTFLSERLYYGIKQTLEEKKQVLLFINRRGYSGFVSCRKCGYTVKCDECDISMTYHLNTKLMHCHYCGRTKKHPVLCPECGSKYIKSFGIGTQKVENHIQQYFPNARIGRMDADTTKNKGSHERIFNNFKNGKLDILIGTQMITKGIDVENVTLVGILAADLSLNMPDFKAAERTFQLQTQVSGRAGRGHSKGHVILQTYDPEHYSIQCSKTHDYKNFYNQEIKLRQAFGYPPFSAIILILFSGINEKDIIKITDSVIMKLRIYSEYEWLGPNPSPISKINKKYRYQILVKTDLNKLDELRLILTENILKEKNKFNKKGVYVSIDINPNVII